ncbi:MAG: NADP-dependent oxidoreductase [Gammaproteobacteria bacterium]|nr:NADP-dependent oxidoreductase [Gammaproteobacteria bacterium]
MSTVNRQWVLAERPIGRAVRESDFRMQESPVPTPDDGQLLIRTLYLSVAPVMRQYMLDGAGFEKPLAIGEVMRGRGVGIVVESKHPDYAAGDIVQAKLGWQEYVVSDASPWWMIYKVHQRIAPYSTAIGVLGVTGFTSYLGLVDIGRVKPGDAVVVSGAAGGVGSNVGQIARNLGCGPIIGIAGSAEKCEMLTTKLGYDAAINYREEEISPRLGELCPDGVDVYFDNVGGNTLDTTLTHLARHARVVLCGRISEYVDNEEQPYVLQNYQQLHKRVASMEAFFIYEMEEHFPRAEAAMARWIAEGRLTYAEDILDGIERMPKALIRLFEGKNRGKQMVRVDPNAEAYGRD